MAIEQIKDADFQQSVLEALIINRF